MHASFAHIYIARVCAYIHGMNICTHIHARIYCRYVREPYTYMHTCISIHIHIPYIHTYKQTNKHTNTYTHTHMHAYIVGVCASLCLFYSISPCVHMHTCVHTCIHKYTYTWTHILQECTRAFACCSSVQFRRNVYKGRQVGQVCVYVCKCVCVCVIYTIHLFSRRNRNCNDIDKYNEYFVFWIHHTLTK